MPTSKRIFVIGDFKLHSPASISIERRRWVKGLIRCGCDVQLFSYRNVLKQFSPFQRKSPALRFGRKKTEQALIDQVRAYHPEVVLILNMEDIRKQTLETIKELAGNAVFVGRDVDWHPEEKPERLAIAKYMDIVVMSNAGSWLQCYKEIGVPVCAFLPCPCDPDIQHPYPVDPALQTEMMFAGNAVHRNLLTDPDRFEIVDRLTRMPNARVYGSHGFSEIIGIDVFRAISNAKIALSINADNNQRLYHSDRLVNCIACGTMTLAKRVPESDRLFLDGTDVKYFDTADECFELAAAYLSNEQARQVIARTGMEKAHNEFNCTRMAQHLLDLIDTGDYQAPWKHLI
jgi:spore maturation protein CgeB